MVLRQKSIGDTKIQVDLSEFQKTFKGELDGVKKIIKEQDTSIKQEVTKLLEQ